MGDYRVEGKIGDGGFGFVYQVERAGRPFALKVIRARELEGWGQREITILRHVKHPNVVRFRACDRWPDPDHGYLCFIMDLVVGRTLERYALEENPSARWVARVVLEVALALAAILQQGVLHRDLKRENILIRDADGRPVLVDFSIGWLAGEPTVTGERAAPGTDEYRSPEYVRFERDSARRKEGYRPDVGDELWALGVTLYWLLTDVLPFGHRTEAGLYERILTHRPRPPHECNPRVPPALSALCMRMLEKERTARFADYAQLCGALDAALATAEGDARWDVPLMDPDAPDATPTVQVPGMGPPAGEEAGLAWKAGRPRRGRKAPPKLLPEPERQRIPAVPAPAPAKRAEAPANPAEALAALLAEVAPERAWEAVPPPLPASAPAPPPPPAVAQPAVVPPLAANVLAPVLVARGPLRRVLSRVLPTSVGVLPVRAMAVEAARPAALLVVALAVVALSSAAAFVVRGHEAPAPPPAPVPTAPGTFPPDTWQPACPTPRTCPIRELAASPETAEAGEGAAPLGAPTPAPANAMPLRKQESRSTLQEKLAPARTEGRCVPGRKWLCMAGFCGWVSLACPGAQVRSTPGPEACPSTALATMEELGIHIGQDVDGKFPVVGSTRPVPVKESTTFSLVDHLGKLGPGTVLSGRLIFGEDRVYGRFTQARFRGQTYSVCLELRSRARELGVEMKPNGGTDFAVVSSAQRVRAVDRFE